MEGHGQGDSAEDRNERFWEDEEPALVTAILTTGIEDRKVRNMLADFRSKSDARCDYRLFSLHNAI